MVSTNKILTVSYGTFSCTLEGFDDSFETMKAIAEYFRDLAQDDRYFGAEPPTPDAEMLARIAEREIARRVEARMEKGGLVLRPSQEEEAPRGDVAPASDAEVAPLAAATAPLADQAEPAPADLASETPAPAPEETAEAEPVAEEPVEAEAVADDTPETHPTTESVADKLQRIRAVVASRHEPETEYTEDEHAMPGPIGDGVEENDAPDLGLHIPGFEEEDGVPVFDDTAETEEEATTPEVAHESDAEDAASESEEDNLFTDTIAALMDDEIASDEDEDEEAALIAAFDEDEDDADEEALRAEIAALEAEIEEDTFEPLPEVEDEDADEPAMEEDAPKPLRARVAKVKRADFEAALAAGAVEALDDEETLEQAQDAEEMRDEDDLVEDMSPLRTQHEESTLSTEEEDELARELAELQAEIDGEDDDDVGETAQDIEEPEAVAEKATRLVRPGRAILTERSIEDDAGSVDRLMEQADTELNEPEGKSRRSAIAHLRAAVAATKADRSLAKGSSEDEAEPYRDDLASAVRPRRPKPSRARSERPAPARPAPLKLVAEQRVDIDHDAQAAEPVRPRRVLRRSKPAEVVQETREEDAPGFAQFAEEVGAHTLPELLEAAAAYMSFVEGVSQFSRPQLMTKLHQAEDEASSREDRLRSFGQLLREGKIEKTGGGRFTASRNIGFRPNRKAG